MVTAIARAFHWQDLLEHRRYASTTALAEALGVDRSYVRRIIALAPDIVEALVDGREQSGLPLERLTKGVPMGWEEQRGPLTESPAERRMGPRARLAGLHMSSVQEEHRYHPAAPEPLPSRPWQGGE